MVVLSTRPWLVIGNHKPNTHVVLMHNDDVLVGEFVCLEGDEFVLRDARPPVGGEDPAVLAHAHGLVPLSGRAPV